MINPQIENEISELKKQIQERDKIISKVKETTLDTIKESIVGQGTVILIFKQKLETILNAACTDRKEYEKLLNKFIKK